MPRISKHGLKRIEERLGASKDAAKKNISKAFKHGVTHKEAKGALKKWLDKKYLSYPQSTNLRVFRGNLYVFYYDTLITVFSIPENIKHSMESNMTPEAYARYNNTLKKQSHKE